QIVMFPCQYSQSQRAPHWKFVLMHRCRAQSRQRRARQSVSPPLPAFRKELIEAGFVEGRSVAIEFRWAEGRYERLPDLATELVGLRPALIVAGGGSPTALAAKAATQTIPILFVSDDAVDQGLVASIARPGGNLTGIELLATQLTAKRLQLLLELVPK